MNSIVLPAAVSEEYEEFLNDPGSYWPEWDPHAILGTTGELPAAAC